MGRAAAELSDLAVITSDNPRSEDPGAIIGEILAGIDGGAEAEGVEVEPDRRAAIALALGRAAPGDCVVIAGKGHEQGQEFEGGRKTPFDDREVAREELAALAAGARAAMIELAAERIASEAQAEVIVEGGSDRPAQAVIDSNSVAPGDLFFGLRGERADGGEFAAPALEAGAWGAVVSREHADAAAGTARSAGRWLLASEDPLLSLQLLARAWRRELDCPVVGITGSTGKTSVKDIARAILPRRVHASPENYNTEIGLPLTVLAAGPEVEVLVLEMAMRGMGQIAELCRIAEPDVAAITNIGPVHLELLGTLEAIAEAKAEILDGLHERGHAVVPADAEALEPHLHDSLLTVTFGPGGDVFALGSEVSDGTTRARVGAPGGEQAFEFPFTEAHNLANALCAIGIGVALGEPLEPMAARSAGITFSALRGERVTLGDGIVLVNDSYNANPISMRAALESLAATDASRRPAVLGEMKELGPDAAAYHREVGALARELGIGPLVGVGELSREYAADHWVADAEAAVPVVARAARAGRRRPAQGLPLGRARAGRRRAAVVAPMIPLAQFEEITISQGIDRGEVLIAGMAAMLITIFLGPKFIDYLRVKEFGQQIREEGPQEHHAKAGTPTMGGLIVFLAAAIPYLVLSELDTKSLAVLAVGLGAAGLGFADDFIKITKKRSLGLGARWKILVQIGLAVFLWWMAYEEVGLPPEINSVIFGGELYIGPVPYLLFIFFVISGASNAVNLTDGLDGLAAGSCAIALLAYTAITITTGDEGLALVSASLVGACVGFLWFNAFPAAVFMGDTGLARSRGGDRSAGGDDADGAAADRARRDLRDRGALGRGPGDLLQGDAQTGAADGAGPPPLRDARLVGDEDHAPVLDRRRRLRGYRLHALPERARVSAARPELPGGPYLVVGLARSGQAAARLLAARGEEVVGVDAGEPEGADELRDLGGRGSSRQ